MAEDSNRDHDGRDRTEDRDHREGKRFLANFLMENFQWILIIFSVILGLRKPPEAGETAAGGKEIPGWILKIFSSLTKEDETEFNLILDSFPGGGIRPVEAKFREDFIADGYDETDYRLSVVDLRREYLERLRNPAPEDKSGGRLTFASLALQDSAIAFLSEILAESAKSGTPEEIFERQKKLALERKLIKKVSGLKKAFQWSQHNKFKTLLLLATTPFLLAAVIYQILNLFLG
jgi:hypothetical protein